MRSTFKTIIITMLALVMFVSTALANPSQFKDLDSKHWAFGSIQWGVENKALQGYEDGTFRPNNPVTEAEFLKTLIAAYEKSLPESGDTWYDKYYEYAKEKGWFVKGLTNEDAKKNPILRQEVAIILSSALGNKFTSDDEQSVEKAINDLYDRGLSNGKTAKTVEGFDPKATLTRAEAVQFVYNFVKNSGIDSLMASSEPKPDAWSPFDQVTFKDDDGVFSKYKVFADQHGLNLKNMDINFNDEYKHVGFLEGQDIRMLTAYKVDTDGTVTFIVQTDLEKISYPAALDLISHMFTYDKEAKALLDGDLIPALIEKGMNMNNGMRMDNGWFSMSTEGIRGINLYQTAIKVKPH